MDLVVEAREQVEELFPWDVDELIKKDDGALILDIREECEFSAYHIEHTMPVKKNMKILYQNWSKRVIVK